MNFNHKLILRIISIALLAESVAMIAPLALSLYDGDFNQSNGFIISIIILAAIGIAGFVATKRHRISIKVRESFFIVLLGWVAVIFGSTMPYLFAGKGYLFVDSLFEATASWTTTAAWVIPVDDMARSLVLWKAVSSWLGGMGVILLVAVLVSEMGITGQKLAFLEIPGPDFGKDSSRMSDILKRIYVIYVSISVVEVVLLMVGGVPLFEAVINTMRTISTAGIIDYGRFSKLYLTPYTMAVLSVFSLIGAMNFVVYIKAFKREFREAVRDYELRAYLMIVAVSIAIVSGSIWISDGDYLGIAGALMKGASTTVSYATTTGTPMVDVNALPSIAQSVLLILMIIGGASASTAGGLKVIRFVVFLKLIVRGMYKRVHPNGVKAVMLKDIAVSAQNVTLISASILIFMAIYLVSTVVLSIENLDTITTFSAPIALLTNSGIGFSKIATSDFGIFSWWGKIYCSTLMLLGRLEIYPLIMIFSRSFWNSDKVS